MSIEAEGTTLRVEIASNSFNFKDIEERERIVREARRLLILAISHVATRQCIRF